MASLVANERKVMHRETENQLYEQIAQYMRLKHPTVTFHFDLSGLWTPSHQLRNLYGRLNRRAWPDFFVAKPATYDGTSNPCAGLFLELKTSHNNPYRKDGTLKSDPHVQEQAAVLAELREQGYYAEFAAGLGQAVSYIEAYLGMPDADDGKEF